MALSGSFSNSVCNGHYAARVDWSAVQNITNNTSTITCKLYLVNDWSLSIGARSHTVTIDGTAYTISGNAISTTGTHLIGSCSKTINHSNDGSKSISLSFNFDFRATISGTYYSNISGSTTAALNTIARVSTPSLSASSAEFGGTITVYTNRATSSFTHHLYYSLNGGSEVSITTGITDSYKWTIPSSLMSKIPNLASTTITFRLYTFNGSTNLGNKTISFKATVPSSIVPNIKAISTSDPKGYLSTYGGYVQGKSTCYVSVTPDTSGTYGSTITTYRITVNGSTYTNNNVATPDVLKTSGTNTISATITDSRGRTHSSSTTISVLAYTAPTITTLKAIRCTASGTADDMGEYMKVTMVGAITSLNSKNGKTFKLEYKTSTASSWTTSATWTDSYSLNTSKIISASPDYMYDVRLTATDNFSSTIYTTSVDTAYTLIDFKADGKGISFGKVSTQTGFDCNLDAVFRNPVTASRFYSGYDSSQANSMSCSNWFRSNGSTGWLNATYGGGWYMNDSTWIRAHNNKGIYTTGEIYGGTIRTSSDANLDTVNSDLATLRSRLAYVSGTLPSATNTNFTFSAPSGFNHANCILLSITIQFSNSTWYDYRNTDNIVPIYTGRFSYTSNSNTNGRPFIAVYYKYN